MKQRGRTNQKLKVFSFLSMIRCQEGRDRVRLAVLSLAFVVIFLPELLLANDILLRESFSYTNGVVINEYSFWNPDDPAAHTSSVWELTSGSLFAVNGAGWTGIPDDADPDANSSNGNDSAIFRLTTVRSNFTDVAVSFGLLHQGLTSTASTPPVDWDGIHIFLRYQSQSNLYYASINRRDNQVVIKKKIPGGPDQANGGTYYDLSSYLPYVVPSNVWQFATASVQNNQDGSVSINLYSANTLLVSAIDNGTIGGAPIRAAGKVGIRGDNANVKFENFTVTAISTAGPIGNVSAVTNLTATPLNQSSVKLDWNSFPDGLSHFYFAQLFSVSATAAFSPVRLEAFAFSSGPKLQARISGLQSNSTYNVYLFHSKDLINWSLPSNVAVVHTSN